MYKRELPPKDELLAAFEYNHETGELKSKDKHKRISETQRYKQVYHNRRLYVAHRIIWKMVTGSEPEEIDHINRDGKDNRWCNLREADRSLNCINQRVRKDNKYGRGIHFCNRTEKFVVQIQRNKVRTYVKCDTLEQAIETKERILNDFKCQ